MLRRRSDLRFSSKLMGHKEFEMTVTGGFILWIYEYKWGKYDGVIIIGEV